LVRVAVVITDEAQDHCPLDRTGGSWSWARDGALLFKTLMGPGGVVVLDKGLQDSAKVGFVEDQKVIEALFAYSAYPPFGEGIGCSKGGTNDADTLGLENGVVSLGELLIIVADQETRFDFILLESPYVLPGLLGHPEAIR
jgi:hypothetical protein